MLRDYYKLVSSLPDSGIEKNINKELSLNPVCAWKLLVLCTALVNKTYIYNKCYFTKEDLSDIVISLYIYVKSKKQVTLENLFKIIRKECKQVRNYYNIYSIVRTNSDGEEVEDTFLETILYSDKYDQENRVISINIINFYYKKIPDDLKPLVHFYFDTGIVLDNFLHPDKKCLLMLILCKLGRVMISETELLSVLPRTIKGKVLLYSVLASRSPILFVLYMLTGDFQKVATFTEIFGDQNISIPNSQSLLSIMKEVSSESSRIENNVDVSNGAFIESLIRSLGKTDSKIFNTFSDFFTNAVEKENSIYNEGLDKLIKKYDNNDISSALFFKCIQAELNNSVNMMKNIQELTDK